MAGFRVVLDACSIVPIARTDLLLTFAQHKVYFPLWSREILGEVERAIVTVSGGKCRWTEPKPVPPECALHSRMHW